MKLQIIVLFLFGHHRSVAQFRNPLQYLRTAIYTAATEQLLEVQNAVRSQSFLWCGFRDSAPFPSAVSAVYPNLDSCCRNHDNCPLLIERGECHKEDGANICNDSFVFPILDCKCEARFKSCLKRLTKKISAASVSERILSETVEVGYFGVMPGIADRKCISKTQPVVGCGNNFYGTCTRLVFDEEKPRVWQLFRLKDVFYDTKMMKEMVTEEKKNLTKTTKSLLKMF